MDIGTRMKVYEHANQLHLLINTPVIIRIDGKAFHTYTRDMVKPFSDELHNAMVKTTEFLMRNIQGAQLGYTQSDEISILLADWYDIKTEAWFKNKLSKMISVSASLATGYFNSLMTDRPLAFFDSRVFNLPMHDVNNYFIWRQQDASRNSVQMLARAYFSHKELHAKNINVIQEMLLTQHNVNWNDIEMWKRRGTCIRTEKIQHDVNDDTSLKTSYVIDNNIPIFTQDRSYVNRYCTGTN